jgi:F-type H+-transporting ATPase subunit gamma
MAAGKEIRKQISSFKNTQKITKAMQLVASSKIRKVQARMRASMPYAEKVLSVIGHVANANPEYKHPFLQNHQDIKRVGYIIISSDRGLCGGLNANLFRYLFKQEISKWTEKGVGIDLCLVGDKAINFFKHTEFNIIASVNRIGREASAVAALVGAVRAMVTLYDNSNMDRLFVVYNKFINTMTQKPSVQQLLPLIMSDDESKGHFWDYIYETDAKVLLNTLLRRYMESQIYQAVVDNVACEEAARMVAMKSATDNADTLIDELQVIYNKTRQAAITQEISEIVGGAEAV